MKIVHIAWMFTFGGIETMLVNIVNEQVRLGHSVRIILIEDGRFDKSLAEMVDPRVKFHFCHRPRGGNILMPILRLNLLLIRLNPNTIHVHSASMYRLIFIPWLKKVVNATMHALPKLENTIAVDTVPRLFSISEAVRRDLLAFNGTDSITNPNGIRTELIKYRNNSEWSDILQIVQVGRLDHGDKGQHILILAGKELLMRGYHNFIINFIGSGPSQSYLEDLAEECGLLNNVKFHGMKTQSYIFEHLCDYNVLVQPSIREGFGNTVAEAMAAKLAVIVSSGQGPEEIVDYGRYGYVFNNGDPIDCANKIEHFLLRENKVSQIEEAYKRAIEKYDIKVNVKTYIDNYVKR